MIINNIEFEFDLYDNNNLKELEIGDSLCQKKVKEASENKELKMYEKAELITEAIYTLFTNLFGEEITKQIFTKRNNYLFATKMYAELINQATTRANEANEELSKFDIGRLER